MDKVVPELGLRIPFEGELAEMFGPGPYTISELDFNAQSVRFSESDRSFSVAELGLADIPYESSAPTVETVRGIAERAAQKFAPEPRDLVEKYLFSLLSHQDPSVRETVRRALAAYWGEEGADA